MTDTYLYEVLVRFDENGLVGSHVKDMHKFTNPVTGKPVYEEGLPREVTTEEVGKYLTKAAADAVEKLAARVADFLAETGAAREALQRERDELDTVRKELATKVADFNKAQKKLASAAASIMSETEEVPAP